MTSFLSLLHITMFTFADGICGLVAKKLLWLRELVTFVLTGVLGVGLFLCSPLLISRRMLNLDIVD